MDLFFKEQQENYFNHFQIASDLTYDPESIINDNDDNIHDAIQDKISERTRSLDDLPHLSKQPIPDISGIIDSLLCAFC